ncbi:phage minor head protein [Acinetobacter sp. WCHAc060025]|uniref:phage head morphogenesis protein n=1 Tax=Acinetobacter sp. WCHAc060025 TaxID=2518625 RepID=UPI001022D069|nr:phage minor head protein [Acinetobacter sp. WCHAc060025]RZG76630.1 phage head morphogenesis protein [Acinetobacter sp. WCHAc060025]
MQPVTFLEALRFAHERKIVLPDEFYSMDLKTRQLATTVGFLSSIEQVETVIKAVNKSIADGSTYNDFKKLVAENEIVLSDRYLKNVFRTNIQTAYGHGRWQQHQRNKDKRPYLMYSAIDDSRVRPSHLELNRIIRHIDDPFWLLYYPPWGFMCRCTVIALTEAQAKKYGITSDEDLPKVAEESGWSTSPLTFGEMETVVDQKIADSILKQEYLLDQKQGIKAEWTASKELTSLLAPMTDSSRDLFDTIANTVIPLDPNIRPSAIKTLIDYVQGNDAELTAYIQKPAINLAEDVLKQWVQDGLNQIQAVSNNSSSMVTGVATLQQVASYQVGQTIQLNAPMLMRGSDSNIIIQIENAKGLGIDLEKLNAGQGVLFEIGLSFEVVSIDTRDSKLVYTLKALVN